ncbi:uncharacterized protein BXZ73DRAFT_81977 [Epithele typhae]|uniref:uncharacterized protein n=1 Tax=Epithele typhae TaxID=378194 RepID=UPI002007D1C2|nr:uncharacterized protein BXZ73DRAFT_81977 [Epithele typhae]KAH9913121.1 hypothetical protein BXZ73DRAFT_81977 [Epithele typhae]
MAHHNEPKWVIIMNLTCKSDTQDEDAKSLLSYDLFLSTSCNRTGNTNSIKEELSQGSEAPVKLFRGNLERKTEQQASMITHITSINSVASQEVIYQMSNQNHIRASSSPQVVPTNADPSRRPSRQATHLPAHATSSTPHASYANVPGSASVTPYTPLGSFSTGMGVNAANLWGNRCPLYTTSLKINSTSYSKKEVLTEVLIDTGSPNRRVNMPTDCSILTPPHSFVLGNRYCLLTMGKRPEDESTIRHWPSLIPKAHCPIEHPWIDEHGNLNIQAETIQYMARFFDNNTTLIYLEKDRSFWKKWIARVKLFDFNQSTLDITREEPISSFFGIGVARTEPLTEEPYTGILGLSYMDFQPNFSVNNIPLNDNKSAPPSFLSMIRNKLSQGLSTGAQGVGMYFVCTGKISGTGRSVLVMPDWPLPDRTTHLMDPTILDSFQSLHVDTGSPTWGYGKWVAILMEIAIEVLREDNTWEKLVSAVHNSRRPVHVALDTGSSTSMLPTDMLSALASGISTNKELVKDALNSLKPAYTVKSTVNTARNNIRVRYYFQGRDGAPEVEVVSHGEHALWHEHTKEGVIWPTEDYFKAIPRHGFGTGEDAGLFGIQFFKTMIIGLHTGQGSAPFIRMKEMTPWNHNITE